MIHGAVEVVSIKKQFWVNELGPNLLARGDHVVEVRFLAPQAYQGRTRAIGVIRESDLTVDGVRLKIGDVIEFDAAESSFSGSAMPDTFTNFRNTKLKVKSG
jgi:hypothetical protein